MKTSAKIIGGIVTVILLSTSISQCVGSLYRAKLRDDRRIAMQNNLSRFNQTNNKLEVEEVTKVDSEFDFKLREAAKTLNEMLPTTSDGTGRTDSVVILANRELRYYCTILDDNWKSTEEEQKELLLEKNQYANMSLFQIGHVTLSYAYYKDGECIMIVKLLPGEY